MEAIIWIILAIVAAAGVLMASWWETPSPTETRLITLLPVRGHLEDLEYRLRKLRLAADRGHFGRNPALVVFDLGMDEETSAVCDHLLMEDALFVRSNPDSIAEILLRLTAR